MSKDPFGDRMKEYERRETGRTFMPLLPVYARLDGRGFSKFTRGMDKPFDQRMSDAMIETTKYLVQETHARIGYTQSDEISLIWCSDEYEKKLLFGGKVHKMTSVLPAMATAKFNQCIRGWEPFDTRMAAFDARASSMPSKVEATNAILWRAIDASRNAISMAAQANFSHKSLQGCSTENMLRRLHEAGVDFDSYSSAFRFGTFATRKTVEIDIPEDHREKHNGQSTVLRSRIETTSIPFSLVQNRTEVIFDGEEPDYSRRDV